MTNLTDCGYRFGLTGTLDGTQTHRLVLEGLFGRVKNVTTTKELIDSKKLADFKIKALILSIVKHHVKPIRSQSTKRKLNFSYRHKNGTNLLQT